MTNRKRGIHMSAKAVREILAGTKTQIRVLPKEHPETRGSGYYFDAYCSEAKTVANPRGMSAEWCWWTADHRPAPSTMIRCPHGKPGDWLWVKEEWQTGRSLDKMSPVEIGESSINAGYSKPWAPICFLADGHKLNAYALCDFGVEWGRVRSPLHLPSWASRIELEVVEVRVQRLQEITEDDARAEGCKATDAAVVWAHGTEGFDQILSNTARGAFAIAWDALNCKRRQREWIPRGDPGYPGRRSVVDTSAAWFANPWVWAITFRRLP